MMLWDGCGLAIQMCSCDGHHHEQAGTLPSSCAVMAKLCHGPVVPFQPRCGVAIQLCNRYLAMWLQPRCVVAIQLCSGCVIVSQPYHCNPCEAEIQLWPCHQLWCFRPTHAIAIHFFHHHMGSLAPAHHSTGLVAPAPWWPPSSLRWLHLTPSLPGDPPMAPAPHHQHSALCRVQTWMTSPYPVPAAPPALVSPWVDMMGGFGPHQLWWG